MQVTCPACFAHFPLESALEDAAGRDLMMLLSQLAPGLARPLVAYLSLFRSKSRALSWDRALRLARETTALAQPERLATALAATVETLRAKRDGSTWKPLSNHNYLRRVLEDTPEIPATLAPRIPQQQPRPIGKRLQSMVNIEQNMEPE